MFPVLLALSSITQLSSINPESSRCRNVQFGSLIWLYVILVVIYNGVFQNYSWLTLVYMVPLNMFYRHPVNLLVSSDVNNLELPVSVQVKNVIMIC